MNISEFDFDLPESLIAHVPTEKRDHSRLMVLNRKDQTIQHHHFYELPQFLKPNDLLVTNNSKVIPARIFAHKETGAKIEILLLEQVEESTWTALLRPSKRIKINDRLIVADNEFTWKVLEPLDEGQWEIKYQGSDDFWSSLEKFGEMPLPPYITKKRQNEFKDRDFNDIDRNRYQTVYAKYEGSVAAPTAGLHFTDALIQNLKSDGVQFSSCTLHVGPGTFQPVKCENVLDHPMHYESYSITQETCDLINHTRESGNRIIPVGTTSVRVLESIAKGGQPIKEGAGITNLLIYPGFKYQLADALITNFHLPRSTLILLVAAFAGHEFILNAYQEAIKEGYRFYSYGDSMLIL